MIEYTYGETRDALAHSFIEESTELCFNKTITELRDSGKNGVADSLEIFLDKEVEQYSKRFSWNTHAALVIKCVINELNTNIKSYCGAVLSRNK